MFWSEQVNHLTAPSPNWVLLQPGRMAGLKDDPTIGKTVASNRKTAWCCCQDSRLHS